MLFPGTVGLAGSVKDIFAALPDAGISPLTKIKVRGDNR